MQKSTIVGGGLVAVGVVAVSLLYVNSLSRADEEAPIIVRNGSLDIVAGTDAQNEWTWEGEPKDNEDDSPSYSYEPTHKYRDRSNSHWVKVTRQSGTCTTGDKASGKVVQIDYTYDDGNGKTGTKTIVVKRGASGYYDYRTKVRPSADLSLDSSSKPPKLTFSVKGYISAIRVDSWSCSFPDVNSQPVLTVCSSSKRPECQ